MLFASEGMVYSKIKNRKERRKGRRETGKENDEREREEQRENALNRKGVEERKQVGG